MTRRQDTEVQHALVAFGANLPLGDAPPEATIASALAGLQGEGFELGRFSGLFRTPCFPAGAGPDYVNAAAQFFLPRRIDAAGVLAALHRVEAGFGRERQLRWGMRTLDLDLLALGDSVLPDARTQDRWRLLLPEEQLRAAPDQLIVPHPRLQDRAFVLVPLAVVAPDWVHPRLGLTVTDMLAALPEGERRAVVAL